jgi:putative SOS response-associated peptidase YedK
MCSRYKYNPKEFANLKIRFIVDRDLQLKPEYDLYPKQYAPVLISTGDEFALKLFRWWLTPFFFETEFTGYSMYNAKAETLTQKGSYKHLLGKRHCLVPASGFYEPFGEPGKKVPMYFNLKSGDDFTFPGLWDTWKRPDGELLHSFVLITTEPNDLVRPLHPRMPVILRGDQAVQWLSCKPNNVRECLDLLKPYSGDEMQVHEEAKPPPAKKAKPTQQPDLFS